MTSLSYLYVQHLRLAALEKKWACKADVVPKEAGKTRINFEI